MDMDYYKQYEPIFGAWTITRQIGVGGFGQVFEIEREDFGTTYKAALKVITVPSSEDELLDVRAASKSEDEVRSYFASTVEDLVKEFALMSKLKGNSNVVSYENHQVIEHKEGIGWDILIQMELLTPLKAYAQTHTITVQDVIRLGIDMCKALELCQKYNIIHRDVKPENMFVSDSGDFKLGDFGIARTVEKTSSGLSKKGTYPYMAPEIYKGEPYGSTVDLYSLGLVLYRLLNENRTPFLPAYPAPITPADRENALGKRFSGAPLPPPLHAKGRLAEIVLKACAFDPKDRYSVPLRMREDLEAILYDREEGPYIYPDGDSVPQKSIQYIKTDDTPPVVKLDRTQDDAAPAEDRHDEVDKTFSDFGRRVHVAPEEEDRTPSNFDHIHPVEPKKQPTPKKGKKGMLIGAVAGCLAVALCVGGVLMFNQRKAAQALAETQAVQDTAYDLYQNRQFSQCADYAAEQLSGPYAENEPLTAILASARFELGEYDGAAELYQQLSEKSGYEMKVENLRDYAVCLARLGRLDEAATIFVLLTDQGASADVTGYVLGETYYAKGDYENAAREFRQVLDATEDEVLLRRCYNSLAETYRESGDYAASIDLLEDAVKLPQMAADPVLYEMLGMAYYQRNQQGGDAQDSAQAAKAFDQAIRLGVRKEYMYINAAFCYHDMGDQRTYELLDELQELYPKSCQSHAIRALFYIMDEGKKNEAERDYTAAQTEYETAESLVTADDNRSYLVMAQTYLEELEAKGWLE